ncbi:MAG: cation:proton antiporter [Gemmatimonadetes bacterium]|nr:cation:proton antiporter [Gemmatimonadota bacterium]
MTPVARGARGSAWTARHPLPVRVAGVGLLALALGAAANGHGAQAFLLALLATIFATSVLGHLATRVGQPAVLGELVAGVVLGRSVLGVLDPADPAVAAFAELGVLILLFEIGLHTDLRALRAVGAAASAVALAGVVLPFAAGFFALHAFGLATLPALVGAAALTATSVGISARVLGDLGLLEQPDGQVVLGAAVLDDVVGLIILSVIAGLASGTALSAGGVAKVAGVAIGFVAAAVLIGSRALPPLFGAVGKLESASLLGLIGLAVAFLLAWLADYAGSAMIIGAFAAGVVLHPTPEREHIEAKANSLGQLFIPVFFASVGAAVDLQALLDPRSLAVGGVLVVIGVAGKVAAGIAPWWYRGNKLLIGVAMVPRGEVGLIFAQMGLAAGAIDAGEFGAVMLMVLATTFITPPALSALARRGAPHDPPPEAVR